MSHDLSCGSRWSFAGMGVTFEPITATLATIGSFAAANAGAISTAGTILGLAGTGVTAMGQMQAGAEAKASAQSQALQLDQQATQARASSQRQMMEHQRQTALVQSQLQARAASSGAGAQDPTVTNLGDAIEGRGEEEALNDLYNGENTARGLEDTAMAKRISGDVASQGATYSALGTIGGGIGTGFSRFAYSNPTKNPPG